MHVTQGSQQSGTQLVLNDRRPYSRVLFPSKMASAFCLINLPEHILNQILSYLTYSEISECRRVCQTFNLRCSSMLNNSFNRVERFHLQIQRNVKQQLPRRESERRSHPLSRHADILSAVETRLSLLSMTYSKYIELNLCCFIPGKVLDELYRILRFLQQTDRQLPRCHEFLQELRDISSMAMEHFEEHVVPRLKNHITPGTLSVTGTILPSMISSPSSSPWSTSTPRSLTTAHLPSLRQEPLRLQQLVNTKIKAQNTSLLALRKEQHEQRSKINEHRRVITEQERKLQEQSKLIMELTGRVQAQEIKIEMLCRQVTVLTGQSFSPVDPCNLMARPPLPGPLSVVESSLGKGSELEGCEGQADCVNTLNKTSAECVKSHTIDEDFSVGSCETDAMTVVKCLLTSAGGKDARLGKSEEQVGSLLDITLENSAVVSGKKQGESSSDKHGSNKSCLKRKSGSTEKISDDAKMSSKSVSRGKKRCRRV